MGRGAVGPDRVKGAYAWRWFLDANVPVAFGSDFPVEIVSPFWGFAALTRQDAQGNPSGGWHPEHLLTIEETLRGFTAGSAYAAFAEERLGTLAPGFRADLTLIDRDRSGSRRELSRLEVVMTIVPGRCSPTSSCAGGGILAENLKKNDLLRAGRTCGENRRHRSAIRIGFLANRRHPVSKKGGTRGFGDWASFDASIMRWLGGADKRHDVMP